MADESVSATSTPDFSKMKVPDLKKELKNRGLSITGNKIDLIERLQRALKSSEGGGTESVDDLEEDLLNDDDDDHIDANDSVLETDLEESITSQKRKASPLTMEEQKTTAPPPPKKVILNRNNSITCDAVKLTPVAKEPEKEKAESKAENNAEKKDENKDGKQVIKLSQLTAKERLEMRAKKFGVSAVTPDIKKAVRAERFGLSDSSASSITSGKVSTSVDVLKQRAARFGGSVSSVMSSLEYQEKLEKRKQRFGSATTTNGTISDIDKAKERLERFKQPVK